jgi:hypothetical protein
MMIAEYKTTINKTNALNSDIINTIHTNFSKAVKQVSSSGFADSFNFGNAHDSAKAVWLFLKNYIKYVKDPDETQMIRLPARFVADRQGDCKSYSLLAASVLAALGYKVAFRYASYKKLDPTPSHVYVVMPDENIIVDGCYKFFNKEKKPLHYSDYIMDVLTLSGIADRESRSRRRQQRREERRERREERKENKTSVTKKVTLAPARNAFYVLLRNNVFGYATKMKLALQKNEQAVVDKWKQLGGNVDTLKKTIDIGAKKKAILGGQKTRDAASQLAGIGVEPVTTTAAGTFATIAAAAAPVILAISALLKSLGIGKGNPDDPNDLSLTDVLDTVAKAGGKLFDPLAPGTEIVDKGMGIDHMSTGTLLLIGGGLLAALLLIK